jgi:hypothetical protein
MEWRELALTGRSIIFEKKYGVDVKRFSTTEQVDEYMKGQIGRDLRVKKIESGVVTHRGNTFPLKEYNIDEIFDKAIRR